MHFPARALLTRLEPDAGAGLRVLWNGVALAARTGDTVADCLLAAGVVWFRDTPGSGAPRGPWCLMGVCFDCLVVIDGVPNRQACMVTVTDGMQVARQDGARSLDARSLLARSPHATPPP